MTGRRKDRWHGAQNQPRRSKDAARKRARFDEAAEAFLQRLGDKDLTWEGADEDLQCDYGDRHQFNVRLVAVNPAAPQKDYPVISEKRGEMPPQCGTHGDEDEEQDEREHEEL